MKNKIFILFLISYHVLIFVGCNSKVKNENIDPEKEEIIENLMDKMNSLDKFYEIWQSLPLKKLPLNEATNFDNIKKGKELNEEEIKILQLNKIYKNYKNQSCKFFLSYKLEFSDTFYTIIINVFKGEHELETILINYSLDEKMIDYKIIAYDEIAESISKKKSKIERKSITISDEFYLEETKIETSKFHINKFGEINPIKTEFTSNLRPNKIILLNRIYFDTIQFSAYDNTGDYYLLLGKKNKKDVSLTYDGEWDNNEKYNFKQGDFIKVTWKMDSVYSAGDGEALDFYERAIDAEKIKSNENQSYIIALKDFLVKEWILSKKTDSKAKKINFENNVLTITGSEGFDLSSYDFNDAIINKTENTEKINITIYNVGGGAGGNVVVSEMYILTIIDATTFEIDRGPTKLIE